MNDMADTIAAVATGGGVSAVGVVRISGNGAISAADKVFRAANGVRLVEAENRRMYYGELVGADGGLIDLCLCMISRGPESYTGEDTVEFHCHGSPVVLSEALRALFSLGIRQALAGEFTKRSFLNGRMDLTQAEAVIDLIEAETPMAAQNAAGQLRGAIGTKLESVYSSVLNVIAHFHAAIDYPDDDVDDFEIQGYLDTLRGAEKELSLMLSTHERGRVLRDGVPTAIIGRPNTGKSSLLNALLGYERAIVAGTPGTTRDTIEEKIVFGGLLLRLIDTAGLRRTKDAVEELGVSRARIAVNCARLVVVLFDGSTPLREDDFDALRLIPPNTPRIIAVNKSDLPSAFGDDVLSELGIDYCRISALSGEGLDILEVLTKKSLSESETRLSTVDYQTPTAGIPRAALGDIITNTRQAEAISRARDSIIRAIDAVSASVTPDAVVTDIEAALSAIGEMTGKTMRDDIISRIFDRFCVGK